MNFHKISIIAFIFVITISTGCAKNTINPEAQNASSRSLSCIEEVMSTYSIYESNQFLSALDATLECQKEYSENADQYAKEHYADFAAIEKRMTIGKIDTSQNSENEKSEKIESELENKTLFGFFGIKGEALDAAKHEVGKYESMKPELQGLYQSYLACLDYNLALSQDVSAQTVSESDKTQIIGKCAPVIDKYLVAGGPVADSGGNPTIRAEKASERRFILIQHSKQYLDGKIKFKK